MTTGKKTQRPTGKVKRYNRGQDKLTDKSSKQRVTLHARRKKEAMGKLEEMAHLMNDGKLTVMLAGEMTDAERARYALDKPDWSDE